MIEMPLEIFNPDGTFPFFIEYGMQGKELYMHRHKDFTELVIVLEGSALHIVDDEEYTVSKGDVFVIGKGISHGYKNADGLLLCNIMYRHESVFTQESDISGLSGFQALFVLEPLFTKEHGFNSRLKLRHGDFDEVRRITDSMLDEFKSKRGGRRSMIYSQFMTLAVMLSRLYSFDAEFSKPDVINIAKAASYIERHLSEDISTAQLAKISNYSQRHFIRLFTSTYGATPLNFITKLRIKNACALLRSSDLTITEIAIRCGFGSGNYFSRIFKQATGITPREYRSTARLGEN